MHMGFRWYGEGNDAIKLSDIKQIPGVTSIVWALHHKMPFPGWEPERMVKPDQLFKDYADVDHEKLRANLKYFLEAIMPTCEGRWSTIPTTA